ncbi:acetate/propionate family kinase [Microbispora sp. ATCC PTA-5024]|uniref:acetate/propionate family kinase n=1 Tax=Microbispora sp. ATCC PTA-5024 TaxID=316330 RepID=UPI0003DDCD1A|nr:acetate kinase [Microbispora sp. ATCC PTA-5024]ETK36081.1 acetate kinase [Microbispora sp. ATCC PTA-5024]
MTGQVLVLNSGSSSIKYRLIDMATRRGVSGGLVERIGERESVLTHDGVRVERPFADHDEGLRAVLDAFAEHGPALGGVAAVGHRVVHGGSRFVEPTLIDDAVERAIEELAPLAPLHNPANLEGIRVARRVFPRLPHVAVFDTAFHGTIPRHAHTYAVPKEWTEKLGVRRYGFHGTSAAYVSRRAAELLGRPYDEVNTIVLHLGNGASATAVRGGRSADTSMGITPLAGLVMGTRSGDVDPALPAYLNRVAGMSLPDIDTALNKESGLLGMCGANDLREVWRMVDAGDEDARLAMDVYGYRLRSYIGAYYAALGHVDAIVFTAGVGENDPRTRALAVTGLTRLGVAIDDERNAAPATGARMISPDGAEVALLVVPTDEELEIADQVAACLRAR